MLAVLLLPTSAWGDESCDPAVAECATVEPTPDAPVPSTPATEPETTPQESPAVTPSPAADESTPEPSAAPSSAPGVDTGVFVDPSTGALRVDENTGVAVGIVGWLCSMLAGLFTAWLVMP